MFVVFGDGAGLKTLQVMGCDIHMYIEYKKKEVTNFESFGERINPGRNYFMFSILCNGVRGNHPKGFEEKGLPEYPTLGRASRNDVADYVSENPDSDEISRDRAEEYVSKGYTKYTDERKVSVYNSDWHSHSWLTAAEYETAIAIYNEHPDAFKYQEHGYKAVLGALKSLESDGLDARVVFWFDN